MSDRLREDLRYVEENWDKINDPEGRVAAAARRFLALTETGQEARLPCEHGRYEDHPKPDAEPTGIYGVAGMAFADEDWCRNWSAALADYLTEERDRES